MAEFLVTGDERHRIEFGDGSWIDIRTCVTGIERARWAKRATVTRTKLTQQGGAAKALVDSEMEFDNETFLREMLGDIVVGWSAPEPVDIAKLSERAVTRIQEEFNRLNPTAGGEDLGESAASSPSTTAT